MKKKQVINKFIQAFNAAYPLKLPCITVSGMDEAEKPTHRIFASLAPKLAVLHYRQLGDYLAAYNPRHHRENHRALIRQLLNGKIDNPTYFERFERYYWGEWPKTPWVEEESVCAALEDVSGIKYQLELFEEDRHKLQAIINQLHVCVWPVPPGILKDRSEQLIERLQNYLDEYFAHCAEAGVIFIAPMTNLQYQQVKKEAGKDLLRQITQTLSSYQREILDLMPAEEQEMHSFWKQLRTLFSQFLTAVRCLIFPTRHNAVHFFQPAYPQPIMEDLTQSFFHRCEALIRKNG